MDKNTETKFSETRAIPDIGLFLNETAKYVRKNHLDIGCGQGKTTLCLFNLKPYSNITGYDPDQSSIDSANINKKDKKINFISNLESISDKKFDSASTFFVYHEAFDDIFRTASEFLKPGSFFTIIDYDLKDIGLAKFEKLFNSLGELNEVNKIGLEEACITHTRVGLKECVQDANKSGFKTIESKNLNAKYFFWAGQKI